MVWFLSILLTTCSLLIWSFLLKWVINILELNTLIFTDMARRNQKDWDFTETAVTVRWSSERKCATYKRFQLPRSTQSGKNCPKWSMQHVCKKTTTTIIKSYVITGFSSKRKEEFFKTHSPTWLSRMGQVSHFVSTFVYYIQKKEHTVTAAAGTVHKKFLAFYFAKGLSYPSFITMIRS